MIYDLKKILDIGEENGFAVPAFNVYNLETVMGVMQAAEETGAPVIFQMYSRLFDSQIAQYVAPIIREAMNNMKTPVAFHLDHGAGVPEVLRAFRYGATGVMIDASRKPLEENITITKGVVEMAAEMGIGVEGELGEVGKAAEGVSKDYTKVEDAAKFVNETGVCALAVAVGTAHGHYKQAPVLALKRIEELHEGQKAHLVLHGGSGVPDDQIAAAVKEAEKAAKAKRDAAVAKKAEELKAAEAQRDEARKAVENAEAGKKAAEEQAAALRAELEKARKSAAAMDNKALAEFGVLFRQAQETVNRLTELAGELDEENRPKVYRALGALRNLIAEKAGEATA